MNSKPLRVCAVALVLAAAGCTSHHKAHIGVARTSPGISAQVPERTGSGRAAPRASTPASPARSAFPWQRPLPAGDAGHLQPGSDPSALPGDLLIADKLNNRLIIVDPQGRVRWEFPRPGDLAPGQTFLVPDDAFFTPDGREIVATEEDNFVIRVIDVFSRKIVYQYGKPGVHGTGPDRVWNPDDAMMLPNGDIITADIKNQRILLIGPGQHTPLMSWGQIGHGYHDPPRFYGAPNGVFPIQEGHFLVTEIRGDWVDSIDLAEHVFWSAHPAGVAYPSDSNEIGPGRYLTVDYSKPGQILVFDQTGKALWRYKPSGTQAMNHPSLALPLPNGDIVCNDDANHRVIVVDPRTNAIVWQYGHTGVAGSGPGYLNNPDGVDLAPPYSLVDHTIG
jgi:hypothetical protein